MPTIEHENQIEAIKREIEARGLNWKTKKNVEVHIPEINEFGLIDLCGYKKEEPDSLAKVECYEVEHSDKSEGFTNWQSKKNKRKLEIIKNSFPPNVKVSVCQLSSSDNHLTKCKSLELINNQQLKQPISSLTQSSITPQKPADPIIYNRIVYSQPKKQEKPKILNKSQFRVQLNRTETHFGTIVHKKRMK